MAIGIMLPFLPDIYLGLISDRSPLILVPYLLDTFTRTPTLSLEGRGSYEISSLKEKNYTGGRHDRAGLARMMKKGDGSPITTVGDDMIGEFLEKRKFPLTIGLCHPEIFD